MYIRLTSLVAYVGEFIQDISDRKGCAEGEVVSALGFGFCNVEMFSRPVLFYPSRAWNARSLVDTFFSLCRLDWMGLEHYLSVIRGS